MANYYVCQNCGSLRELSQFNDDCRPGWTHGVLTKVELPENLVVIERGSVPEWMTLVGDEHFGPSGEYGLYRLTPENAESAAK